MYGIANDISFKSLHAKIDRLQSSTLRFLFFEKRF